MKRTLITVLVTTVVVLTLIGVFASMAPLGSVSNNISSRLLPEAASPVEMYSVGGAGDKAYYAESPAVETTASTTERLVIQNVDMSIVVADPAARLKEIADMAVEMGGFVVSSNLYRSTYGPNQVEVPEASITIRVPASRLDEALEKIKVDVVKVTYENRSGQDVTSQYVDLKSRLAAKEKAAEELLRIMDKAETAEDVLAVYMQIQNIQAEIESLKGQIKYYEEAAALSAINIQLVAAEKVKPIEIGGWKLQGTVNDAIQDLIGFTQGFTRFLIRLFLTYLPSLILIALPSYGVFLGARALSRRFKRNAPKSEEENENK
jgi:hypothetical protein